MASRADLRRRGTPATPQDLAAHDCLHDLRPGDAPAWQLAPVEVESGAKVTSPVAGPLTANNSLALCEAALRAGKLVQVLPGWRPEGSFAAQLDAIRPYSPSMPRAVQALVGHLREGLWRGFGE